MSRTERISGSGNRPGAVARRAFRLLLLGIAVAAAALWMPAEARANRLAGETSPYLREHAQDPVDWYPWGEAAFARSQKELKPIFLSIGYSACHWCHVMQRESFSDAGIARLLNDSFVAIKVDREERPDLDTIYMDAVVTTTGAGGWPMSLFLTPDLKPFQGGTYYPRDRFAQLLTQIAGAWKSRRPEVVAAAESIRRAVADMQAAGGAAGGDDPGSDLLGAAVTDLKSTYDRDHGGFGRAPKFPPHGALALLLRAHRERGDQEALQMATTTLVAMARGGLYDQVGGGFHRYTTDAAWRTPHFEKMLYDNALLVPLYLVAWRQTDRPEFRLVAEETLEFLTREMKAPSGGFAASLDADTEGEEGRYYTWTPTEIAAAVGPNEAKRVAEYFGVTDKGSLPDGRSVLFAAVGDERFAAERGLNLDTWRRAFEKSRSALVRARARRPAPARNDNVLAGWNGLAISAFATGFRATQNPDYLKEARGAAAFVLGHLRGSDGTLRVSWRDGRVGPPGVLEDTALLVRGLLDLDAVDPAGGWRRAAVALLGDADRFEDARGGWFRAAPSDELFVRPVRFNDEALPGGNAMMVENLARLSLLTRDAGLMRAAMRAVDRAAAPMRAQPSSYPYMILARDSVRAAALASAATPAAKPAEGGLVATASAATPATPAPRAIPGTVVGRANRERVVESVWNEPDGPVRPGDVARPTVRLTIKSGWHINSSKPTLDYLIGTRVEVTGTGGSTVEGIDYPEGHLVRLAFADEQLSVYEKDVVISPRIRTPRDAAAAGGVDLAARLTYQACSDKACLPPETVEFKSRIAVAGEPVAGSAAASSGGGEDGAAAGAAGAAGSAGGGVPAGGTRVVPGQDQISLLLRERGLLFVIGFVFLGGLALCLTPCVYPMIPITLGYFANQAPGAGWGRRFSLPALYVLGIAITYSILGVITGMTGGLFGAVMQNPFVVGGMVLLFIAMALWMFGVYELRLPGTLTRLGAGRAGALGAFVMGLTLGLVAAPCIGPFIVALIAFVGASGSPLLGFWLFFVLALGMGFPFLLLGAFSGAMAALPRSGAWLIYAKKVMGVGILGVALYFMQTFLSDRVLGWSALLLTAGGALYLGWLEPTRMKAAWFRPTRLVVAALTLTLGIALALPLVRERPAPAWQAWTPAAFDAARASGKPILIDFFAVWCAPCRELDRNTYSHPGVLRALDRFALLKADLTDDQSAMVKELYDRFQPPGVPTVIFLDAAGNEKADLRLTGFEGPVPFLKRLEQVR